MLTPFYDCERWKALSEAVNNYKVLARIKL